MSAPYVPLFTVCCLVTDSGKHTSHSEVTCNLLMKGLHELIKVCIFPLTCIGIQGDMLRYMTTNRLYAEQLQHKSWPSRCHHWPDNALCNSILFLPSIISSVCASKCMCYNWFMCFSCTLHYLQMFLRHLVTLAEKKKQVKVNTWWH